MPPNIHLSRWMLAFCFCLISSACTEKKNVPQGWTFRTLSELAAQMLEQLKVPKGLKAVVLFDAFFLNPKVLGAIRRRGFSWASVAGGNRNPALPHWRKSKIRIYRRT